MTLIYGSGGGGGKGGSQGGTPSEAKDNLASKQFAKVLDLIGEGEISGLVDGAKSIYLNNTPLQAADGSYNFKDVSWEARTGTSSQTSIPITINTESVKATGLSTIAKASPGVVQITDSAVEAVKVIITVPALQEISDKGDIYGSEIQLKISVQYAGGSYADVVSPTLGNGKITGRTGDLYKREYKISLNTNNNYPVNIKVTRVTDDSTNTKLSNAFSWTNYTEIKYDQRTYPNTALVGMRLDAEQFSSIPTRKYLVKGTKVKIPHNATVRSDGSLSYSGVFNGTLGAAQYTNDPSWCLYDLLTSNRYGLGDHLTAGKLDKFAFYAASVYCGVQVDNGMGDGGTEPRFSCNVSIQSARDAYNVVNQMCSVFRAMPFWAAGTFSVAQDSPADASYLFTLANVLEPGFTYSSGSQQKRATVAVVKYLDLELRDINYEEVKDTENIARFGSVVKQIDAFACTSRGQAHRLGKWLLYMENVERETVTFTTSVDSGVVVRPGQIIEIADPLKAGERRAGRIKSATTSAITPDDSTGIAIGTGSQLSVILSDGTVEVRDVASIASGVINVSPAFSKAPSSNNIWVYQTTNIQTSTWRVLGIEEAEGDKYIINAAEYHAGKYNHIEAGIALETRDITDLNIPPSTPTDLSGLETIYENTGIARVKIILTWQNPSVTDPSTGLTIPDPKGTDISLVRWRFEKGNWSTHRVEGSNSYEILDTVAGNYTIEVYSVSASGLRSASPVTLDPFVAVGKTASPQQVSGVSLLPIDEASAILSWNRSTELDVLLGGQVKIRHSQETSAATWQNSQEIVVAAAGSQTQKQVPLLTGTYLLKFADDGGRESPIPGTQDSDWDSTRVVTTLPTPSDRLVIQTVDEHTGNFTGSKSGTAYDSSLDALKLTETSGAVGSSGEYTFANAVSLAQVYDINIKRNIKAGTYFLDGLWDARTSNIDDWGNIDEVGSTNADRCNISVYLRSTEDDPSSSPTWTTWREFSNVLVRARGVQFKAILTSTDTDQNIAVTQLGAILELQGRTESITTPVTTGSSAYAVTFSKAFKATPTVLITPTSQQSGDFYELSSISRTGFTVTFKNGSSAVARSFVWSAAGHGKEIT